MKWLFNATLASLVGAVLIVHTFDAVSGGAQNAVVKVVKPGLFVATWTAITTGAGIRGLSKFGRSIREKAMSYGRWLDTGNKRR